MTLLALDTDTLDVPLLLAFIGLLLLHIKRRESHHEDRLDAAVEAAELKRISERAEDREDRKAQWTVITTDKEKQAKHVGTLIEVQRAQRESMTVLQEGVSAILAMCPRMFCPNRQPTDEAPE